MYRFRFQISLFLIILGCMGCHRPPEFPETPHISFNRLHLTDTSTLILTFNVMDGNGDIGLATESENLDDSFEPYHAFGIVVENDKRVTLNGEYEGPFDVVPVALFPVIWRLFKGLDDNGLPIFENETVFDLFRVGDKMVFWHDDLRPEYTCAVELVRDPSDTINVGYEIISFYSVDYKIEDSVIVFETLVEEVDTVFVQRNPFHLNIYVEILIKTGDGYTPFEYEECDPGFSARFPVFDRSDFGRPLDGSISYTFFSTQFAAENSFLLNETLRLKFYIYDRTLNRSNVVETRDFTILGLRNGDLVGN